MAVNIMECDIGRFLDRIQFNKGSSMGTFLNLWIDCGSDAELFRSGGHRAAISTIVGMTGYALGFLGLMTSAMKCIYHHLSIWIDRYPCVLQSFKTLAAVYGDLSAIYSSRHYCMSVSGWYILNTNVSRRACMLKSLAKQSTATTESSKVEAIACVELLTIKSCQL